MKVSFQLILISVSISLCGLLISCNNDITYGDQLKSENNLIDDFISKQNIRVVTTEPSVVPYPANLYYKTPTGLYINLTDAGETTGDSIVRNDDLIFRYIKYTLASKADTAWYLNTLDSREPITFYYLDLSQQQSCKGWHEAASYMKYNNSHAKIIVYSKLGFSSDQSAVIPYGYDIYMKIRK